MKLGANPHPIAPPQRRRYSAYKTLVVLGTVLLFIRLLPLTMPIRAANIAQTDQAIAFTDRNGYPLGTLLSRDQEHTSVVPLDQVSPLFVQAIIAVEDRRFYQHGAVDWWAVGRAIAEAIQARRVVSGASTIPMQLARMLDDLPSSPAGKLQQVWQAWRIAAGMNREDILQAYVNRLPMGGNLYGVEAAARTYFGVPAKDLSLAQASLLAALPNDPTDLNPYYAWDKLKERQRYVLDRMVQDGKVGRSQADRAFAENLTLQPPQKGILAAPHYLFWLAGQLSQDHPSQIRTTLDLPLQQFVEAQVRQVIQNLTNHNVRQAAALVLDNRTGAVLAYVGSPNYFDETQNGRNDGVQSLRQPGSTLKPFVYELALERGFIQPNTILADVPTYYAIPGAKLYKPTDYSETFQGPVRVRFALANSLNIPAVRVLEKVGVDAFLNRLRELGFQHLKQRSEYYGLGLALGSGEVSLWELAHAYRTMARRGESLANPNPAVWALIMDMLSDRQARAKAFGVDSVLSLPFPAAVKTGTSSDYRDTWTVGFTTDYTIATWVGNFDNSPMREVSGVTGAAPLWNRIMLRLHQNQEPPAFAPPEGMTRLPICALSGKRPQPGCPAIVQEYLNPSDLAAYREPDPFFQRTDSGQIRLTLPPEYREWLASQPDSPLTPNTLKILSPRNGDTFIAPPGTVPRLQFKLAGSSGETVQWRLNGQSLSHVSGNSYFWSMQPGDWVLEVQRGEQRDRVQFQVDTTDPQPARRGFSVGKPLR